MLFDSLITGQAGVQLLGRRRCEAELMDQPGLDTVAHRDALEGLRRANLLSTSVHHLWNSLEQMARLRSPLPLRVLDVACGGADVAIRLAKLAQRRSVPMIVHGCDISPTALAVAREAARASGVEGMNFYSLDVLSDPLPREYDVIISSLFLHHLSEADAPRILRAMADAARVGICIEDLLRSPIGYALCWVGTRLVSRSQIVREDGIRSVRAAYAKHELEGLLGAARLTGAQIRFHWPERFFLRWQASGSAYQLRGRHDRWKGAVDLTDGADLSD